LYGIGVLGVSGRPLYSSGHLRDSPHSYFCTNVPWNYIRFLDYAAERVFLRKVGGGYIFTHRLLMEYFATLGPTRQAKAE
jgi:hypothetical protein